MKRAKRRGVFWQLVVLLAAALLVLLMLLGSILLLVRTRQVQADQEYFQLEVQMTMEHLSAQLKEFPVVVAQLTENELMQTFLREQSTLERYRQNVYLRDLLRVLLSNNSQISGIDIYPLSGARYTVTDTDWQLSQAVLNAYDVADPQNFKTLFMLIQPHRSGRYSQFAYIAPIYSLTTGEKLATVALFGSCGKLIGLGQDAYVKAWLTDAQGRCFPGDPSAEDTIAFPLAFAAGVHFAQVRAYVDLSQNSYLGAMIAMAAVMLATLLLTGALLIRQLTRPVMMMSRQMGMVKQGAQDSLHIAYGGVELTDLCEEINGMLLTIDQRNRENLQMHEQLYQVELARIEAQLYALRSQINPHFLYNTLQTIRGMALHGGMPEVAQISTNMAIIFRYIVCEDAMAALGEEMNIARRYMEIMNARQDGTYEYIQRIEPALQDFRTPRMVVQPMIENSVKYAFDGRDDGAQIVVACVQCGEEMKITVCDNGSGMTPERLAWLREEIERPLSLSQSGTDGGIGLRNIHQRLRLRYGERYGLRVDSDSSGTRAEIRIPLIHQENASIGGDVT